jgi:phage tail sheath gpL-like
MAAESLTDGTSGAAVNVTFTVEVPGFLYLKIAGSDANDTVTFDLTGDNVGDSTPIAADKTLLVTLRTNGGNVDLEGPAGNLVSGGNNISLSKISIAQAGSILAPQPAASTANTQEILATGGLIDLEDTWTLSYANDEVYPEGTYTNSAVTFTASLQ